MRDTRRDKAYFDTGAERAWGEVEYYWSRIQQPETLKPYNRMAVCTGLVEHTIERLQHRYCRGDAIADLGEDVDRLLEFRKLQEYYADALPEEEQAKRVQHEEFTFERFMHSLWWLSFAVCLERSQDHIRQILALADNEGQDRLFDTLAHCLGDTARPIGERLIHPRPYQKLMDVIDADAADRPALMVEFMDAWYPAVYKRGGLREPHTITENYAYRGYWCYEAPLVVKLYGIDDASFR
uniref:PoNe immunity protein domain-containing protein n=1 Tax=Arhodomonas sp. AD133 TaxID=3415009 RepID=UPI003EBE1CCD